jgi:tagaturonate reductase
MSESKLILQFGTGRFLRAFADCFVHESPQNFSVVAVQSTPGPRAELINQSENGYPVYVRGMADGITIDETVRVESIEKALIAETQWADVLQVAIDPELKIIVSNTTESSYVLDERDAARNGSPNSYPAKLASCLLARFESGEGGLTVAPSELVEHNGSMLHALVLEQSRIWEADETFGHWVNNDCVWLNSLVDRMVVPPSEGDPALENEPLCAVTEPFALWAIQRVPGKEIPFIEHTAIQWVDDLEPYFLRKVRILNGAHTAMVARYLPQGFATVKDVMANPEAGDWVRGLIFEEILPAIAYRVEGAAQFAFDTLDRLRNPFFEHRLTDIAAGHEDKVRIRLETTYEEYQELFGTAPRRIQSIFEKPL